jgi:hypothetical protein
VLSERSDYPPSDTECVIHGLSPELSQDADSRAASGAMSSTTLGGRVSCGAATWQCRDPSAVVDRS